MAIIDKMWDALATVIKMNDKIELLAATAKSQQDKIDNLTARMIRLETVIEFAQGGNMPQALQIDHRK